MKFAPVRFERDQKGWISTPGPGLQEAVTASSFWWLFVSSKFLLSKSPAPAPIDNVDDSGSSPSSSMLLVPKLSTSIVTERRRSEPGRRNTESTTPVGAGKAYPWADRPTLMLTDRSMRGSSAAT
ncbi:hypothetical protein D9M73_75220 [compost metagenome]